MRDTSSKKNGKKRWITFLLCKPRINTTHLVRRRVKDSICKVPRSIQYFLNIVMIPLTYSKFLVFSHFLLNKIKTFRSILEVPLPTLPAPVSLSRLFLSSSNFLNFHQHTHTLSFIQLYLFNFL